VTAVDTFDGRGTPMPGDTLGTFRSTIERHGVASKVSPVRGEAAKIVPNLPPVYDLAFVDAAHDYESVRADAALALGALRPGGLLAFHDYGARDPGVTEAVDELLAAGAELVARVDTLAVVRPAPAACVAA
jgi:Predicted methyltransferase